MKIGAIALMTIATVFMFGTAWQATAQDAKAPHPSMAPVEQYLMEDRNSGNLRWHVWRALYQGAKLKIGTLITKVASLDTLKKLNLGSATGAPKEEL